MHIHEAHIFAHALFFFLDPVQRIPGRFDSDGRSCAAARSTRFFRLDDHAGAGGRRRHCEGGQVSGAHFPSKQSTLLMGDENPSHGQFDVALTRETPQHAACSLLHGCVCMYGLQCVFSAQGNKNKEIASLVL